MSIERSDIDTVRRFNRFYTGRIGVINEHILASPFTLAEARILFDLLSGGPARAAELAKGLLMDGGQISRLVNGLSARGMLRALVDPADGRARVLELTVEGEKAARALDRGSNDLVAALLGDLPPAARPPLTHAMRSIVANLGGLPPDAQPVYRDHRVGELGHMTARQAEIYQAEYGWHAEFEALVAGIYHDFVSLPETPPKKLWVADLGGVIAGSVFVAPSQDPSVAQLRVLYVEPFARGRRIGQSLVDMSVAFARAAGYRGITLWTHKCLDAALRCYANAGFTLDREENYFAFGQHVTGQYYSLIFDQ